MNLFTIFLITLLFLSPCYAANTQQEGLQAYRIKIDELDARLIKILGERMKVVDAIGRYKASHNIPALQPKRFEEILNKNIQLGRNEHLSEAFIRAIMKAIHEESLSKETILQIK
ncbi:MAG: chorismate mutase [Methylobacter sp.]|nr:chorismate mutase [Methylobacter sp.]